MKLKAFIIIFILGPILFTVTWELLWFIYDLLDLFSVTVESFSNLTLGVSGLVFALTFFYGFKSRGKTETKQTKNHKSKKRQINLDKDITIKDVAETFKPSIKNAILEFIIIGNGKNLHQIVPFSKNATYKSSGQEFKIENANLLVQKRFLKPTKIIAIFNSDGTPVKIEGNKSKVTAEILSLAQRSGALGRTIKEMFSTHFDLKKILFFVVLGVVIVIVFLVMSGGIF